MTAGIGFAGNDCTKALPSADVAAAAVARGANGGVILGSNVWRSVPADVQSKAYCGLAIASNRSHRWVVDAGPPGSCDGRLSK
jgi:hypothetical protein